MEKDKQNLLKYIFIGLFTVIFLLAAFLLLAHLDSDLGDFEPRQIKTKTMTYNGAEYVLSDSLETFLVLGLDKFDGQSSEDSYNNDKQADFLMLFVFDDEKKVCSAIHINRDTMTNVNILGVSGDKIRSDIKQIALAHTYGNGREVSCRNVSDAVSELLLGIKVDHYVSITMDAVSIFNDMIGGVEVEILEDFTAIDETMVKGSVITLQGDQALTYIRSRFNLSDSSNIARMERQRQYIDAVYAKFQNENYEFDSFSEKSIELSQYVVSDRSVNQLKDFAGKFKNYTFNGIYSIDGEAVVGDEFMEFYPNDDSIKKIVIDLFYEPQNQLN